MDLYNQAYQKSLAINERETERWKSYRAEHEELKQNLQMYSKQLKVDILIPVGSKAFISGHLYHTGEVMASHGSGYFSDCSIDQANQIITHRILSANEVLQKYEKERDLFTNKVEMPFTEDAFRGREIIEEYDETREEIWRREHRIRSKESKLREAKERNENNGFESDQTLMDRLEELEMMEELEQEIDNLTISVETDDQLRRLMSGEMKLPARQRVAHGSVNNTVKKVKSNVSNISFEEAETEQLEVETTDDEESSDESDEEDASAEFLKLLQDTKAMNKKDKFKAFKNKLSDISSRLKLEDTSVEEKVFLCDLRYEVEEALDFLDPSWENVILNTEEKDSQKSKSIKFADSDSVKFIDNYEEFTKEYICKDDSSRTLQLKIVHSPVDNLVISDDDSIGSPADIYRLFEHCMHKTEPVSPTIVKKSIR